MIYALIFAALAVLFLLPEPWRGLAPVCVPVSAAGFLMGKEIACFRVNSRHRDAATRSLPL